MQAPFWPQAGSSSSVDRHRCRVNRDEFVQCQVRANETYSEAKRQFSARNGDVLMNAQQSPHKLWSTLKSAVFGLSSSLPPLVGGGEELVCESVGTPVHNIYSHICT